METKELQRQLKGIANLLLTIVSETERLSNSVDDGILAVMIEAGMIEAYYDLQKLLNK